MFTKVIHTHWITDNLWRREWQVSLPKSGASCFRKEGNLYKSWQSIHTAVKPDGIYNTIVLKNNIKKIMHSDSSCRPPLQGPTKVPHKIKNEIMTEINGVDEQV